MSPSHKGNANHRRKKARRRQSKRIVETRRLTPVSRPVVLFEDGEEIDSGEEVWALASDPISIRRIEEDDD